MQKALWLPLIVLFAVGIGGSLYLYGGPAFNPANPSPAQTPSGDIKSSAKDSVTVLSEGSTAKSIDWMVNYRITNAEQFATLWQIVYGDNAPVLPRVNFAKNEVLAVFDGSHTTGGYGVRVTSVKDEASTRTITVTHTVPGERCNTSQAFTNPFTIVQVKASPLPVTHVDETQTTECP